MDAGKKKGPGTRKKSYVTQNQSKMGVKYSRKSVSKYNSNFGEGKKTNRGDEENIAIEATASPFRHHEQPTYRKRTKPEARLDKSLLALSQNNSVPREINRREEVENENLSFATSRLRYQSGKGPISPHSNKNNMAAKYTKFSLKPEGSD